MTNKDKQLCWECQRRAFEYVTSPAKVEVKQGLCRDCYERREARKRTRGHHGYTGRTAEMKENTYETKYGTGHG
jgi:hypothetical protein